jgi:hypothetical protein
MFPSILKYKGGIDITKVKVYFPRFPNDMCSRVRLL